MEYKKNIKINFRKVIDNITIPWYNNSERRCLYARTIKILRNYHTNVLFAKRTQSAAHSCYLQRRCRGNRLYDGKGSGRSLTQQSFGDGSGMDCRRRTLRVRYQKMEIKRKKAKWKFAKNFIKSTEVYPLWTTFLFMRKM